MELPILSPASGIAHRTGRSHSTRQMARVVVGVENHLARGGNANDGDTTVMGAEVEPDPRSHLQGTARQGSDDVAMADDNFATIPGTRRPEVSPERPVHLGPAALNHRPRNFGAVSAPTRGKAFPQ